MGHSDLSKIVSKFSVSMQFFFHREKQKGFIFKVSMTKWLRSTTLLLKLINVSNLVLLLGCLKAI